MLDALCSLLRWERIVAEHFVAQLTGEELDALTHHVEHSSLVGCAAVVYRARVRLAAGNRRALLLAEREANHFHQLIKQDEVGHPVPVQQDDSFPLIHRDHSRDVEE